MTSGVIHQCGNVADQTYNIHPACMVKDINATAAIKVIGRGLAAHLPNVRIDARMKRNAVNGYNKAQMPLIASTHLRNKDQRPTGHSR